MFLPFCICSFHCGINNIIFLFNLSNPFSFISPMHNLRFYSYLSPASGCIPPAFICFCSPYSTFLPIQRNIPPPSPYPLPSHTHSHTELDPSPVRDESERARRATKERRPSKCSDQVYCLRVPLMRIAQLLPGMTMSV